MKAFKNANIVIQKFEPLIYSSSNLGGYCDKKCTIKVHWRLNGSLQNHKHFYYETEWFKYKTLILFVFRNENLCVNLAFIINIWKRENGEKR